MEQTGRKMVASPNPQMMLMRIVPSVDWKKISIVIIGLEISCV